MTPRIVPIITDPTIKFLFVAFLSSISSFCPILNSVHGNISLFIFLNGENDANTKLPPIHILVIEY